MRMDRNFMCVCGGVLCVCVYLCGGVGVGGVCVCVCLFPLYLYKMSTLKGICPDDKKSIWI